MSKEAYSHLLTHLPLHAFDLGGVLYHANYFHLYEQAREAFLRDAGLPYPALVAESQFLAVRESHQDFRAPIYYGDELTLLLWFTDLRKASVQVHYSIHSRSKHAHSEVNTLHYAWTKLVFVHKKDLKFAVSPFPEQLVKAFNPYCLEQDQRA